MDLDGWSLIWFVVPGIIVPAALLVLAFRSPSWKQMTRWATQAQVTITTENEDMIRRRLARARRYRSLVSFPFWWVLAVPVITGPLPEWANDVIWIPLTGYVLGSILAAVSNTEKTGGLRVAEGARPSPRARGEIRKRYSGAYGTHFDGVHAEAHELRTPNAHVQPIEAPEKHPYGRERPSLRLN